MAKFLLHIDDEAFRFKAIAQHFAQMGYITNRCETLEDALEALSSENADHYELLIVDSIVPFHSLYTADQCCHGEYAGAYFAADLRNASCGNFEKIVSAKIRSDHLPIHLKTDVPIILLTAARHGPISDLMAENQISYVQKSLLMTETLKRLDRALEPETIPSK